MSNLGVGKVKQVLTQQQKQDSILNYLYLMLIIIV